MPLTHNTHPYTYVTHVAQHCHKTKMIAGVCQPLLHWLCDVQLQGSSSRVTQLTVGLPWPELGSWQSTAQVNSHRDIAIKLNICIQDCGVLTANSKPTQVWSQVCSTQGTIMKKTETRKRTPLGWGGCYVLLHVCATAYIQNTWTWDWHTQHAWRKVTGPVEVCSRLIFWYCSHEHLVRIWVGAPAGVGACVDWCTHAEHMNMILTHSTCMLKRPGSGRYALD